MDEPTSREKEHADLMAIEINYVNQVKPAQHIIARGLMVQRQAIRAWLQGNGLCDRQLLVEFDEEFGE